MNKKYEILRKATNLANKMHDGQWRQEGFPYIIHPMQVMKHMIDHGIVDEELLCAAVMHDLIEDTPYTQEEMLNQFGERVTKFVMEVTRIGSDNDTILEKMKFMKEIEHKSHESLLLKLSDRWCNVMDYKRGNRKWYPAYYAIQAYPLFPVFSKFDNSSNKYDSVLMALDNIVQRQYNLSMFQQTPEKIEKYDEILFTRNKGIYEIKNT